MQQVMQNLGLVFSVQRQFDIDMILQSVYLKIYYIEELDWINL